MSWEARTRCATGQNFLMFILAVAIFHLLKPRLHCIMRCRAYAGGLEVLMCSDSSAKSLPPFWGSKDGRSVAAAAECLLFLQLSAINACAPISETQWASRQIFAH
ncbi:hypothetical protein F5Y16DRAFT_99132 [Xylariaceae sp. FL0255]|nr:hypothetical protein F5Y16DRAFT_99132 [Xylariaceae sp. FL0255]